MKYIKFLSISLMTSFAMFVSAAINQATITITGEYADDCELSIVEDNTEAANYTSKSIAPFNASSGTVLTPKFYAEYGTKQMSFAVNNSIQNLSVKFTANAYEDEYVMTFSDVQGQMTLANADTSFVIDATKPFAFTCAVSTTMEFTINPVTGYTRTVTSGDYGTLCLPFASTAVEGADIYTVAGKDADTNPTGLYLQEYTGNLVAGTPYVFQATAAELKVTYAAGDSVAATAVNGLVGSFTEENIAAGMYIIDDNQLKKTADATCKVRANGAYFDFSQMSVYNPGTGAPVRFMSIKGAPTSVAEVAAPAMKEGKMILNGQMVIVRDGKMFNAQGAAL